MYLTAPSHVYVTLWKKFAVSYQRTLLLALLNIPQAKLRSRKQTENLLEANVRKTSRKCRSCAACHPGASENMHVQLIWRQFAPEWEFHPGQDRRVEFTPGRFFFSFLVVNTGRGLTTHRIEFNPGRNFSCKQALNWCLLPTLRSQFGDHNLCLKGIITFF